MIRAIRRSGDRRRSRRLAQGRVEALSAGRSRPDVRSEAPVPPVRGAAPFIARRTGEALVWRRGGKYKTVDNRQHSAAERETRAAISGTFAASSRRSASPARRSTRRSRQAAPVRRGQCRTHARREPMRRREWPRAGRGLRPSAAREFPARGFRRRARPNFPLTCKTACAIAFGSRMPARRW